MPGFPNSSISMAGPPRRQRRRLVRGHGLARRLRGTTHLVPATEAEAVLRHSRG